MTRRNEIEIREALILHTLPNVTLISNTSTKSDENFRQDTVVMPTTVMVKVVSDKIKQKCGINKQYLQLILDVMVQSKVHMPY